MRADRGRLGIVLLLIVVVIWGSAYVVTKSGLDELPPMLFAFLRYCVASLLLVPLALARGGFGRLPRPVPWKTLLLMAVMGVALYYVLFNLALSYTTASQTALIQSANPALTAIMAVLWLGERLGRRRLIGIALAIIGVLLIVARTEPDTSARSPVIGSVLAFASILLWSVYTILAKRMADADAIATTALVSLLGTVLLTPAVLIEGANTPLSSISTRGWLTIAFLGAFPSAFCYLLYNRALRDVDASLAGIFLNLGPVIGVISGVVFLDEPITTLALIGGVMALAGVWVSTRQEQSPQRHRGHRERR